jgi:signal transduction histidine kinase
MTRGVPSRFGDEESSAHSTDLIRVRTKYVLLRSVATDPARRRQRKYALSAEAVSTQSTEPDSARRLLDVGRALVTELDPETVLRRVIEEARDITSARYVALGVLDEERTGLERFLTTGLDEATHRAIGELPHGRGVLGVLIDDPRPLRLGDVGEHHASYGFPAAHPPMHTFLGVPILVRGEPWGNLYLTEKQNGDEFTQADEDAVVILAQWAAVAIENARLYERSETRRAQLEQAVRGLEAARDIANAIGNVSELDRILELIVKRGRALVRAQSLLIMLREGDELIVAATAGHVGDPRRRRIPLAESTSGRVLEEGRPRRIADVGSEMRILPQELGVADARTALLVPMLHRGRGLGVLAAFDHGIAGEPFTASDEQLLRAFAASAANAVAIRQSVEADRLRSAIAAAEAERARWARELHDQTLQALGALRVMFAAAIRRGDPAATQETLRAAMDDVEHEIANLRGIISDLRPSLLDDLGLLPALDALLDRRRQDGLEIVAHLPQPRRDGLALEPELETTLYRLVQEALTNVVKHARASRVEVSVGASNGEVTVEIADNGVGFDPEAQTSGFGLAGMRERVFLAGGTLEVTPRSEGTVVTARLPSRALAEAGASRRLAS